MKTVNAHQRKIVLDTSIPNCYNMYMKKRWNVSKEMERIAKCKKIHKLYTDCKKELLHNQQLFLNSKKETLEKALEWAR